MLIDSSRDVDLRTGCLEVYNSDLKKYLAVRASPMILIALHKFVAAQSRARVKGPKGQMADYMLACRPRVLILMSLLRKQ